MANIKELIQSIESGDSSFDEKLAAINQMEETLVAMREQEQEAVNDNVELIVEAIKLMEKKVADQLEIAKSIVPEKGDKGDKGQDGLQGRDGLNGKDGRDGQDGKNGLDGSDGVSVTDAKIDFDGSLIITLSTGREINVGEVVAPDLAERLNVISTMSTNTAVANITSGTIDGAVIGGTTPADGTFTDVSVTTASGQSAFNENDTITGWIYSGDSFSVAGQESSPTGLFIGSNGTKMYVNGSAGDDVNEYTLGTAWDITTGSFVTTFSTAAQDTAPQDIFFKPDGLSMFVMGATNDTVFQYTLGTAWDVSTASYASKSFSVTSQEATPQGIWFKSDGLSMYIVGSTADAVFQYTLGTAWDVSTASYLGVSYNFATQEAQASQVNLSADGLKMWILGSTGDDIWEYTLGTAWNVSTATPVNNFYVGFQDTGPLGLFIDSTAVNRVYLVGSTTDTVYQYYTAANSLKLDTQKLYVDGLLSVNENFVVGQNAYVDGALTVQGAVTAGSITVGTTSVSGTLSATSTITLGGSTTGTTSIGTTATTGTTTIGGTAQTGAITIGQSTAAQTLNLNTGSPASATTQVTNIGTGAGTTTTASTKTINIGTGGITGTNTNIALGSSTSGAISRTTLNGIVVNSISAAVSAAGATQGTATALVSNINNVTVVAAAADGVRLPTAVAGMRILVRNTDAADILKIYPATGGQINALGANAAYSLVIGTTIELFASTATQWYTF